MIPAILRETAGVCQGVSFKMKIDGNVMVNAAKLDALIALDICRRPRS